MNQQEIAKWNDKVDYNNSSASWIVDIIACIIFFPMIICIAYRRGKYRNKIDPSDALENFNMNSSSRTDKRISQTVNIDEEIHRIAKYMREYGERVEAISVDKILITERDYNAIWDGLCQIIRNSLEKEGQNLPQMQQIQVISRSQNVANRIIDKLYDIEWKY